MRGLILMKMVLLLCALAVAPACGADKTIPELEAEAGSIWDAGHEKKRPARSPKTGMAVKDLFAKVEALAKAGSFEPKVVARALRLALDYKKTASNEHFSTFEAAIASGSIRSVEVRVHADTASGLAILEADESLGITPGEVMDRFGKDKRISTPSIHAPRDSPYCYLYARRGGELRVCFKPIGAHPLVSFVWDSNPL